MPRLPAGIPTRAWSGTEGALDAIVALKPLAPAGTRFVYSDVDFIVLGEIVRRVSGQPLDAYAAKNIFQPLGMRDTAFRPSAPRDRIAPADVEGGELRWGEVQDPIAYRMGGVAGHAGAFTTADDLTKFAQMMLAGGKGVLKPGSVAAMTQPQSPPGGSALRGLGWDIDSPYAVWLAPSFSTQSYGHTGYTGTAIWIDPATRTFLIVLTNRLHPDGKGNNLQMLRRLSTVAGAASRGEQSRVMSGIDVLEAYGFRQLAGRRVGLITNRSALDSAGRRTADVLHQAGAKQGGGPQLVALFSPEHGLDAAAEGKIASGRDRATGLPVFSLYGETRRPTPAMLAGLDALIFDMQDVGARYYTYPTTMAYAMEAAAANKLDFYVLDRPDPITASTVQGAVLDDDLTSFITYLPLPVRHGMTLGELARLFNAEKNHRRPAACRHHAPLRAGDVVRPDGLCLGAAVTQPAQARAGGALSGRGHDRSRQCQRRPRHGHALRADGRAVDRRQGPGRSPEWSQDRRRALRSRDLHAARMGLSRPTM